MHDKGEKREVYCNKHRLRILLSKVKADFLEQRKSSIYVELSKVPIVYVYLQALSCFRDKVNEKTTGISNVERNGRDYARFNGRFHGGRGRNRGRIEGRFNGGRHNTRGGRENWIEKTRSDSKTVVLTDGTKIEMHASFCFSHVIMR